ncbi:MAG: hypothetical protein II744_03685 [Eubacterium sp.]|nr:hypothetical protein [Eubacterium sp.]
MSKILKFIVAILLPAALILTPVFYAYAYDSVKAEVNVEITEGGTAVIIPEVNCPVPEETELTLGDSETGKIDIYFTEVGVYSYTVRVEPDKRKKIVFDEKTYKVDVYVTDEDGQLKTTVIAYTDKGKYSSRSSVSGYRDYGPELLKFSNQRQKDPSPPEPPTEETTSHGDNRNPKTGDDTKMEQYFVIAMLASAGLLVLSVIYMIDTNRMLKRKDD